MRKSLVRWWPILAFLVFIAGGWFWLDRQRLPPADYTICNNTEVRTLDPAQSEGVPEGRVLWSIFEGLCGHNPKTLAAEPGVAERWEILDDGKRYVFHLRDNARWSDGSLMTAEDFVYSLRRVLHPLTASPYSHELWYIVNSDRYTKRELNPEIRSRSSSPPTNNCRPTKSCCTTPHSTAAIVCSKGRCARYDKSPAR